MTLEQVRLSGLGRALALATEVGPGDDEAVVGAGELGPALALAKDVEAVGEVAGDLGGGAEFVDEQPGAEHAALAFEETDQVVGGLPDGRALVGGGFVDVRQIGGTEEADLARSGGHNAGGLDRTERCRLGLEIALGIAERTLVEAVVGKPGD